MLLQGQSYSSMEVIQRETVDVILIYNAIYDPIVTCVNMNFEGKLTEDFIERNFLPHSGTKIQIPRSSSL